MKLKSTLSVLAICAAVPAVADCGMVRFSDVGWTDITATTATTSLVLEALGYQTSTDILSVPITYASMAQGDIDVFWATGCQQWKATLPATVRRKLWTLCA
jgi:glycine betaine/proline transport system substrate-binding protein